MKSKKPEIVPAEQPLKVFVSSVMSPELESARETTIATLDGVPYLSRWAFEFTPGGAVQVDEDYLRHVRESDIVIWLLSREVTQAVRNEIREALASDRRLWIVMLEERDLSKETVALRDEVGLRTKWIRPSGQGGLRLALEMALNDDVVRAMRGTPGLGRLARLEELGRASRGRSVSRWLSARLDRQTALDFADDMSLGCPSDHDFLSCDSPLVVITGDVGSGKSLACERLHQHAIIKARDDISAPIPVFLTFSKVTGSLNDVVLTESRGLGDPRIQGVHLVLDGADEVDLSHALRVLAEARALAETWLCTRIVIASRPVPTFAQAPEAKELSPLTEEESIRLVGRASGLEVTPAVSYRWPRPVKDAITRPLFSLLLAAYLRTHGPYGPSSVAELLNDLFSSAVRPFTDGDLLATLSSLAVEVTRRGGGALPLSEAGSRELLDRLATTGLIRIEGDAITYSLPLYAQWFAAQALLAGGVSIAQILESEISLEDWRYPIIIAAGTARSSAAGEILGQLASRAPAFAAQVLGATERSWSATSHVSAPPAVDAAKQLRAAMSSWIQGLGEHLSGEVAPVSEHGDLPPIGVRIVDGHLISAWYFGHDDLPLEGELPESVGFISHQADWLWLRGARPDWAGPWAWQWTLKELRDRLEQALKRRLLLPSEGPLAEEEAWYGSLALMGYGSLRTDPIPVVNLQRALLRLADYDMANVGGRRVHLHIIKRKVSKLIEDKQNILEYPYPDRDTHMNSSWIWSGYSDDQLLRRTVAVYEAAIAGYEALVNKWFSALARRFELHVTLPARFLGDLYPATGLGHGDCPGLHWRFEALPHSRSTYVDIRLRSNRINALEFDWANEMDRLRALRPHAVKWIGTHITHSVLDVFQASPAREIAYSWLSADLMRVGWLGHSLGRAYR